MTNTRTRLLVLGLGILFVVGAVLQFGPASFWFDEGYSYMLFNYDLGEMLRRTSLDMHMPLYYLLLKAWSGLFGLSELALRLFSVVGMLGAISATTLLVRKFARNTSMSWVYVWSLLATSPILLRYASEVRMYAWAAFAIAVSNLCLVAAINNPRTRNWLWYGLASASVLYLHFFGIFLLMAQGLWVWRAQAASWAPKQFLPAITKLPLGFWGALVGVFAVYSVWLPNIIKQFSNVQSGFWIGDITVNTYSSTITKFWLYLDGWRAHDWLAVVGVLLIGGVIYLLAQNHLRAPHRPRSIERLLALTFFVPLVAISILSFPPFTPIYNDRYFVMFFPALAALLAISLPRLNNPRIKKTMIVSLIIITSIGYTNLANNRNFNSDNLTTNSFEQIWKELKPQLGADDTIVATGDYVYLSGYYYADRRTPDTPYKLYTPYELSMYGGSSVVYDRDDLLVYDLSTINAETVWLLESHDVGTSVPANWQLVQTQRYDFVVLAEYRINGYNESYEVKN